MRLDAEKAALDQAIAKAGGGAALAAALGLHRTAPSKWKRSRIPAEWVLAVERLSGVSRHELRPDIYPPPAGNVPPPISGVVPVRRRARFAQARRSAA